MSAVERKVRKPGLYDSQIRAARSSRVHALLKAQPVADLAASFKSDKGFTVVIVGTVLTLEIQQLLTEHKAWADSRNAMRAQSGRLRHTEHGDFTSCFRRGI